MIAWTIVERANLIVFILHAFSAILLTGILSAAWGAGNVQVGLLVPLYNITDTAAIVPAERKQVEVGTFCVACAIVIESYWTAGAHFLYFVNSALYGSGGFYAREIETHVHTSRWVEYAVSASIIWGITMVYSGLVDTYSISYSIASVVMLMYMGYLTETVNCLHVHVVSWILFLFQTAMAIVQFVATLHAQTDPGRTPDFVPFLFSFILLMYGMFGIARYLPYFPRVRDQSDDMHVIVFICISFIVKFVYRFTLAARVFTVNDG